MLPSFLCFQSPCPPSFFSSSLARARDIRALGKDPLDQKHTLVWEAWAPGSPLLANQQPDWEPFIAVYAVLGRAFCELLEVGPSCLSQTLWVVPSAAGVEETWVTMCPEADSLWPCTQPLEA